jgi:hypothetical protein
MANQNKKASKQEGIDKLTGLEKRFVQSAEQYFQEKSMLTDQQESILEGVYREKTGFIKNAVFSTLG